jgi:hypothetical protein
VFGNFLVPGRGTIAGFFVVGGVKPRPLVYDRHCVELPSSFVVAFGTWRLRVGIKALPQFKRMPTTQAIIIIKWQSRTPGCAYQPTTILPVRPPEYTIEVRLLSIESVTLIDLRCYSPAISAHPLVPNFDILHQLDQLALLAHILCAAQ